MSQTKNQGLPWQPIDLARQVLLLYFPPKTMASKAKATSSAKPLHTFVEGNIHISVFDGPRITIQRSYQYQGKAGFAHSIRLEDAPIVKRLLDQVVIKLESPADEAPITDA